MFTKKLAAVMNEEVNIGVIMNALAHMCIGFGADIGKELLRLTDYVDGDGESHPNISEMPFMILKGKSNKLKALKRAALEAEIRCIDFTDTMTIGSYIEQIERTKETKEADLIYYGVVL